MELSSISLIELLVDRTGWRKWGGGG